MQLQGDDLTQAFRAQGYTMEEALPTGLALDMNLWEIIPVGARRYSFDCYISPTGLLFGIFQASVDTFPSVLRQFSAHIRRRDIDGFRWSCGHGRDPDKDTVRCVVCAVFERNVRTLWQSKTG